MGGEGGGPGSSHQMPNVTKQQCKVKHVWLHKSQPLTGSSIQYFLWKKCTKKKGLHYMSVYFYETICMQEIKQFLATAFK